MLPIAAGLARKRPGMGVARPMVSGQPRRAALFASASPAALWCPSSSAVRVGPAGITVFGLAKFSAIPGAGANAAIIAKDDFTTWTNSEYLACLYGDGGGVPLFQVETDGLISGTRRVMAHSYGIPATGVWVPYFGWYDRAAHQIGVRIWPENPDVLDIGLDTINLTDTPFGVGAAVKDDGGISVHGTCDARIGPVGVWPRPLTRAEQDVIVGPGPSTTNNNPGTLHGGMSFSADGAVFDGANGYIAMAPGATLYAAAGSVSLRFRANSFAATKTFLGIAGDADAGTGLFVLNSTTIGFDVTGQITSFTVPAMSTGVRYSLIFTRDATTARLYLDGVESSSGPQTITGTPSVTFDQIGRLYDGRYGFWWDGAMDQVRIFRTVLPAADIATLAAGGTPVSTPFACWLLHDGAGLTAADSAVVYGTPRGLSYAQLGRFAAEALSTFPAWWDCGEVGGVRRNMRTAAGPHLSSFNGVGSAPSIFVGG